MNIALFSSDFFGGNGYAVITREIANQLSERGVKFTLFLPGELKTDQKFDFPVRYELPPYLFGAKSIKFLKYFRNLDLSEFTLVHSMFAFPYSFYAARLAKKYNLPLIVGAQGTYGVLPLTRFPDRKLLKWSYKRAKTLIVPSQFTKEKIIELSKVKYPIKIVHNGVNFERFANAKVDEDLKRKYEGKTVLLTVGGLKPRKGQDLVLKALAKIYKEIPNLKYVMVGDGRWKKNLQDLADRLGITEYVDFVPEVDPSEIPNYFKLADVYIHTPKLVDLNFEGFGIVYLEASACRKPIIASDSGGIKDAVVPGKTGLVVDDQDVDGIAEAILKVLNDKDLAEKLADNGFEYAKEHSWAKIGDAFIKEYETYSIN